MQLIHFTILPDWKYLNLRSEEDFWQININSTFIQFEEVRIVSFVLQPQPEDAWFKSLSVFG